jgi:hypothetical protein
MSVATIRRRLKADKIPGAARNEDRSWSIPVASLVAEGIWTGTTDADAQDDDDNAPPAPDLEAKLTAALHRAELAEQKADLLEQQVGDMRTAMRMLEAGPQRRRRWFRSSD